MENTKKRKKVVNGLVYIVILVLIGVIVYQNHQNKKIFQALNSANESTGKLASVQDDITQKSATRNAAPVAKENGPDDYDDLKYQLNAAEEELDMARGQLADALDRKDETSMSMAPPNPTAMLKTPEGKKKFRNALKNGYDRDYSSLFKEMNLSPDKKEQLKELLADQQIASMELRNVLENTSPTEENKKKFKKQLEEQNNQNDAALAALLGSEDFETYSEYTDRSDERLMIQMFSENLSYDDTLTGEQKTSLLEALYNKRKDIEQGFDEEDLNGPLDISIYDGYIKVAEEAGLSESQEKKLKEYLESVKDMVKKSIERDERIASGEIDPDSAKEEAEAEGMFIILKN